MNKIIQTVMSSLIFCFLMACVGTTTAQTSEIWTGPKITFTKADFAKWDSAANQDRITDSVWLTRQDTKGLFNIRMSSSYTSVSPKGTKWAFGTTSSPTLIFDNWQTTINNNPASMLNKDMVLLIEKDSIFIDIQFSSFTGGANGGGFSYTRSTNCKSFSTQTLDACDSFISPSGKVWKTSNTYLDTIPNALSCDSVITIHLTVNILDRGIVRKGDTLVASQPNANYQWFTCGNNNFMPIADETGSMLILRNPGEYAVELDKDGCVDTSECFIVKNTSVASYSPTVMELYPNPNKGPLKIEFGAVQHSVIVEQYDMLGKVLAKKEYRNQQQLEFLMEGSEGSYFLRITTPGKSPQIFRIMRE